MLTYRKGIYIQIGLFIVFLLMAISKMLDLVIKVQSQVLSHIITFLPFALALIILIVFFVILKDKLVHETVNIENKDMKVTKIILYVYIIAYLCQMLLHQGAVKLPNFVSYSIVVILIVAAILGLMIQIGILIKNKKNPTLRH